MFYHLENYYLNNIATYKTGECLNVVKKYDAWLHLILHCLFSMYCCNHCRCHVASLNYMYVRTLPRNNHFDSP